MAGTELVGYKDDHLNWSTTYYGNGCSQGWNGTDTKSCSIKTVRTWTGRDTDEDKFLGEIQKIGTYYNYGSASAGTAGDVYAPDNTNISDSFCPLGWQLSYGGSGGDYYDKSKSWRYLLAAYNIPVGSGAWGGKLAMAYPLDYVPSGAADFLNGKVVEAHSEGVNGSYDGWTATIQSQAFSYKLQMWSNTIETYNTYKNYGLVLRCVSELAT